MCDTFETSSCGDCSIQCNQNSQCELTEISLDCGDCASILATVEVFVFVDDNLNGNLDNEERSKVSSTNAAVYVDANQDGQYTPYVDPVYEGPYPITISLRNRAYSIGVVPDTLGDMVIGYTNKPGKTQWNVRLDPARQMTVEIPLSMNVAPVSRDISRISLAGQTVHINNIINSGTDRNNNLDYDTAIVLKDTPQNGRVSTVNGVFTYVPLQRGQFTETIQYQICDMANACSQTSRITLEFVSRPSGNNNNGNNGNNQNQDQFNQQHPNYDNAASALSAGLVMLIIALLF